MPGLHSRDDPGMFVGHYAAGIAAQAAARPVPLWVLFVAVQFLDVVWGVLVLAGVEELRVRPGLLDASDLDLHYMPWSHSLVAALGWSAFAYLLIARFAPAAWRSSRAALVVAAAVFSHWPLDLIVHREDLPLVGDEAKVGLELWSSVPATLAIELALLAAGLALYLRATAATAPEGRWAPLALGAVLAGAGVYTVLAEASGPDETAISALLAYAFFAALAWAAERRRRPA